MSNSQSLCKTETTVGVITYSVNGKVSETTTVPIGKPLPNIEVYVLDPNLQPVALGEAGELYIGGLSLGRGYLNQPELTRQSFIPHPFRDGEQRLYKTGDRVRYLEDGNLEFLGRLDDQVKIRGYRIELGEISTVLNQHPSVREAVTITREDVSGEKCLVAYIVPTTESSESDQAFSISQIREFLKENLAEYMMPAAFVVLDNLPLTSNGKVDRKALPAPKEGISRTQTYVAPRTPTEEIIANLFGSVLGIQTVGIHDNFLELGGHSLLWMKVISRCWQIFSIQLPLHQLFESPTVANISRTIAEIQNQEASLQKYSMISRMDLTSAPLSFAQQRLWFLHQLYPNSSNYHISKAVRLVGNLNQIALKQALDEIVVHHEILRTNFIVEDSEPVQVIATPRPVELKLIDLQNYPSQELETAINQQLQQEIQQPFNLSEDLMLRGCLMQIREKEHILLLVMHHIASDGWSIGIFWQQLEELYTAFLNYRPNPLPEMPIQYIDFAYWQRQWLSGQELENQLQYWQQQLKDANPILELPTDYPRPPVQTYSGANESLLLNQSLTTALKSLSHGQGVTLFMTLLAAFQILLYRYSGQEDIIVGSPIAGRNRTELENMIGFFINTLVIRTNLAGNPSFRELLKRVSQVALGAYSHQDMPFEKIVEALKLKQDLSRNPLFQVWFNMLNLGDMKLQLPGLTLETVTLLKADTKFDISLYLEEQNDGIKLDLNYNSDLFKSERIEEMLHQFQYLLKQIVANPEIKITQISLVTSRAELLLPNPQQPLSKNLDLPCHTNFFQQAQRVPQQLAVVNAQVRWTYIELEERTNLLANYLLANQIKSPDIVAIYGHRSACLVWAILGILKAGAAFVILDPAYPSSRLIDCLEIAQPRACLQISAAGEIPDTLRDYLETLNLNCHLQLPQSSITEIRDLFSDYASNNPEILVEPDQLAYIAFTSGSTGKPKGILGTHRPLSHFIQWHCHTFGLNESDRFSMLSGLSHDPLLRDIFTPLSLGATLCIPQQLDIETPLQLADWIKQQQVTITHLTPAMAQILIGNTVGTTSYLRYVFFGGDILKIQDIRIIKDFAPDTTCINFYGATETPQAMGYFILPDLNDLTPVHKNNIPLGRGIEDVQLLLLTNQQNLAGIGELAEIYIRTPYLSNGYLASDELNQERFIINPITQILDDRLYKTGDLGRYLPDGNIEYVGRIDNQVKIRGFRIELGEIEAILNTHPQIQQVVVIITEDIADHKSLIAYVVTSDESINTTDLRYFLKQKLPEYMIPSAFVFLELIPLTPNGKVDYNQLPLTNQEISGTQRYVAPRTPNQEIIANIFGAVLGRQTIGIHDNFFELGGHSLRATQLISRLRLAFEVEIPLRAVFESPTVAEIDQKLTQLRNIGDRLNLPPIELVSSDRQQLPLSFAQERLWFLDQLEGASVTYNISRAVRFSGKLNINACQQALSEIVRRHQILRTSFSDINGIPMQVIHPEARMKIHRVDLRQLEITERETVLQQHIEKESITPFDLKTAPLIRCTLLQISDTENALLLSIHHIVSDGWSMGLFNQELFTLYEAFCAGVPSPLPDLPVQYADFAVWQRKWLSGEVREHLVQYWVSQLQDAPELLQLPTDAPRPRIQTYRGTIQRFAINTDLIQPLKSLSRQLGVTLFMTLFTAFTTLLYRYSGQTDILIGSPIANRNHSEIESLIGFFASSLVLRTRLENNPSFDKLLAQVRETTLKAYEHHNIPFEQVVEALRLQRSLSHSPLFQVMFVLHNTPMTTLELPGVTLCKLAQVSTTAKFDLTLSISESSQGLVGTWEYNTDLFDGSTIERMAGHFQNLLSAIVANPQQTVNELPLLSAVECHQLLVEWNQTRCEHPQSKCIHQLFEEQVERTPQAVAVLFENQQLTYQELNERANQLAHYLQSLGVRPEVLVGICVERSLEMIVGLLGILKAGGAYVPLDPMYPPERLAYMVGDAEITVLLTQNQWISQLPPNGATVVCMDSDWQKINLSSPENPTRVNTDENLAYIIYTSGSTGKSKGVMITHQALSCFIQTAISEYEITVGDRILQFASINFDAAVEEIYPCLSTGATLVLRTEEMLTDVETFFQACEDLQLTMLDLPTAYWHQLAVDLANTDVDLPASLRLVIIGGERVLPEPVRCWQEYVVKSGKSQQLQLINTYGPTETTVSATLYRVPVKMTNEIPIGRPLGHVQTYILDSQLQPLPIGVIGELHIGGDGLARGYLNRAELTQEKFIPHPFSDSPSAHLYKTGDLARYLSDGNIEYVGRIDNQVKIRGFRIELGEIEAVLNTHPQISQAVVIATEDIPANKRLVAYVVSSDASLHHKELREFLKQKLPEYMIPSAFVWLESIPLTVNGKINYKALPEFDGAITPENTYVAPRTPNQEIIANIFASVLQIETVGIHDNFFELGGHSLLAIQVISRLRQVLQINMPIRALFEAPTVASFADCLEIIHSTTQEQSVCSDTPEGQENIYL